MASVVKDPTAYCSECRIQFASYMAYVGHRKRKMKAGEGHIHCEICGAEFALRETLSRHVKQVRIEHSPCIIFNDSGISVTVGRVNLLAE